MDGLLWMVLQTEVSVKLSRNGRKIYHQLTHTGGIHEALMPCPVSSGYCFTLLMQTSVTPWHSGFSIGSIGPASP